MRKLCCGEHQELSEVGRGEYASSPTLVGSLLDVKDR